MTTPVITVPNDAADSTSNYAKHMNSNPIQRQLIDRFHHLLMSKLGELAPTTFLDAGCGEGFVTEIIARQLPGTAITGFDFNAPSVELARAKNPGVTFDIASIYELPYRDNQFDVVGCFEVLEHLQEPRQAIRELARVSKRAVIVSVPHEPWFSTMNAVRGKNHDQRPRGSDPDHRNLWTRRAFEAFMGKELTITWIGGSLPWTICVAQKR
jgi:2-polyprenyl-3-methyl-5-hydroxy-6-metoxy-1,4-benzoquinol methylase